MTYKERKAPVPADWPKAFAMVRNTSEEAKHWLPFSISQKWETADFIKGIPQSLVKDGQFKAADICWLYGSVSVAVGVRRSAVRKGAA